MNEKKQHPNRLTIVTMTRKKRKNSNCQKRQFTHMPIYFHLIIFTLISFFFQKKEEYCVSY